MTVIQIQQRGLCSLQVDIPVRWVGPFFSLSKTWLGLFTEVAVILVAFEEILVECIVSMLNVVFDCLNQWLWKKSNAENDLNPDIPDPYKYEWITNIYEKISLTVIGYFAHLMSRNYILVLCIRILKVWASRRKICPRSCEGCEFRRTFWCCCSKGSSLYSQQLFWRFLAVS